jgi:hypothetical protein
MVAKSRLGANGIGSREWKSAKELVLGPLAGPNHGTNPQAKRRNDPIDW